MDAVLSDVFAEGEHPLAVRMLSGCQQAVNKLSREKISFAQTHFLELTNQNTNIHTEIPKHRNRRFFSSGCQVAVTRLSGGCRAKIITILNKIKFGRWFRYHRTAQSISNTQCADTREI